MAKILKLKKEFILVILLVALYFASRIYHLTLIPIFTDEAIYIRWAEIAKFDASWRFISLTDGKQPLFVWLSMIALRFFRDPLFAGRFVSVLTDAWTMLSLFLLTRELFRSKWAGFIASFLYLLYPFALVYDRMALMDGMVGLFAVWSLWLEVLLVKTRRLDVALILGMVIGGGILTKTSGFFSIYLIPSTLLLFPWKEKERLKKLSVWLGLVLIAILESQLFYAILRLSPFYNTIGEKNNVFVYPFNEWLDHPWRFLIGNLKGLFDWLKSYFTRPMLGMAILSFGLGWRLWKQKLLLLIWFGAPFFALALFGRVLYPRFIFFMTLFLIPLVAFSFFKIFSFLKRPFVLQCRTQGKPIFIITFFLIFLLGWVQKDYQWLTDPYRASVPNSDKGQYLNDWPAGGGINETVDFLKAESQDKKIYVATEGTFGPLPYALEVYLYDNFNVEIRGFWPLKSDIPQEVLDKAKTIPTYFVFNQTQTVPLGWPLKLIAKYQKGIGNVYLQLYQVLDED